MARERGRAKRVEGRKAVGEKGTWKEGGRKERSEERQRALAPFPFLFSCLTAKKKKESEGRKSGLVSRKINYSSAPSFPPLSASDRLSAKREREKRAGR